MPGVTIADLDLKPPSPIGGDWVESKTEGWNEELQAALAEKDSLQAASIQVLTKRNEEANRRIQRLEELVNSKDERIMQLVDIIIEKLGGFDAG
jgi:hypothetical protein